MSDSQAPAGPHGDIVQVFSDVFMVTGTNKVTHEGRELQHSRNMIIVRDRGKLSLINTVRLGQEGLARLEALGTVDKVLRIGVFHGRDDAFYVEKYQAALWALPGMQDQHGCTVDVTFTPQGEKPFSDCSLFVFETARFPEGIIHLNQNSGILISCDSLKNWVGPDSYFNKETAEQYEKQGFFGKATVSKVWKEAMGVQNSDFHGVKALSFKHLLTAHGAPLLHTAHEDVLRTLDGNGD